MTSTPLIVDAAGEGFEELVGGFAHIAADCDRLRLEEIGEGVADFVRDVGVELVGDGAPDVVGFEYGCIESHSVPLIYVQNRQPLRAGQRNLSTSAATFGVSGSIGRCRRRRSFQDGAGAVVQSDVSKIAPLQVNDPLLTGAVAVWYVLEPGPGLNGFRREGSKFRVRVCMKFLRFWEF